MMGEPIVDAEPPIRVAVMGSRGGDRLRHLLENDPRRGQTYEIVGGFVNVADSGPASLLAEHDVPLEVRDIHDFYDERGADIGDMDVREAFDARTAETLAGYDPDLVVLASYLHRLTSPVLDRFAPAIVNAHHSDLTVRDGAGDPVYPGLNATEDAIRNGEPVTRESTHVATPTVDRGPVIARSRPFEVHRDLVEYALARDGENLFDAYLYAHRGWMIRSGGGPTLAKTIELVADGRVSLVDGETYVDGEPGYYQLGDDAVATAAEASAEP